MNASTSLYIHELEAIATCDKSDGYQKMWAKERLEELNTLRQHPKPLSYYSKCIKLPTPSI